MHSKELLLRALNGVLFNIAWLLCVLGGNQLALLTAVVLVAFHLRYVAPSWRELGLLLFIAVLGIAIDSLWFLSGVMQNPDGSLLPPLWLCAIWFCFATTCAHCFIFLHSRLPLAALLGGIFATTSYWAGVRLSEVSFAVELPLALALLAALWLLLFPLLMIIARSYNSRYASGDHGLA